MRGLEAIARANIIRMRIAKPFAKSISLWLFFLSPFTFAQDADHQEPKKAKPRTAAHAPSLRLPCTWAHKGRIRIHFLGATTGYDEQKAREIVNAAKYIPGTFWDTQPTGIVILPLIPNKNIGRLASKELKKRHEIYGTSSELPMFLTFISKLFESLTEAHDYAEKSSKLKPTDAIPTQMARKSAHVLVSRIVEEAFAKSFINVLQLEGVDKVWSSVPRPMYPEDHEKQAKILDSIFSKKTSDPKVVRDLLADPAGAEAAIEALLLSAARKVDTMYPPSKDGETLIQEEIERLYAGKSDWRAFTGAMERVRTADFLANLPDLLCQLNGKTLPISIAAAGPASLNKDKTIAAFRKMRDAQGNPIPFEIVD